MSWKKIDYLIDERKKVVPFITKNIILISQQKPQSNNILSPEHPHVQHHDEDYSPPTITDNIPNNFDHADEPTIPNEIQQVEQELPQEDDVPTNIDVSNNETQENLNNSEQNNQEDLTNNNNLLFI